MLLRLLFSQLRLKTKLESIQLMKRVNQYVGIVMVLTTIKDFVWLREELCVLVVVEKTRIKIVAQHVRETSRRD
jgi:hypothetical protein